MKQDKKNFPTNSYESNFHRFLNLLLPVTEIPIKQKEINTPRIISENRFFLSLHEYLTKLAYQRPEGRIRVLNLACGECQEANAILNYFSNRNSNLESVELIGIDIHRGSIQKARKELNNPTPNRVTFICESIEKLDRIVKGEFDIIIARHPNIYVDLESWKKSISQLSKKISANGILIITTYEKDEIDLARYHLAQNGFKVVLFDKNIHAKKVDNLPNAAFDHYIMILKKD